MMQLSEENLNNDSGQQQQQHQQQQQQRNLKFMMIPLVILAAVALIPLVQDVHFAQFNSNSNSNNVRRTATTSRNAAADIDPASVQQAILDEELKLQQEFQDLIHKNQNPPDCTTRRHLVTAKEWEVNDGFTLELQWMNRYLMTALATNRTLVIRDTWVSAYSPPNCQWSKVSSPESDSWACLYQPISAACASYDAIQPDANPMVRSGLPSGLGIRHTKSQYFDDEYYGPKRVVELPQRGSLMSGFETIDIVPHWERLMGRFWVRAQMAHYLWKPSEGLQSEMDQRLPSALLGGGDEETVSDAGRVRYIAFHIRFTDNTKDLLRDFGRSADKTRSLERYMHIAERIRDNHPEMNLNTIYIATDSNEKVKEAKQQTDGWNVVLQKGVHRSSGTHDFMWFEDTRAASASAVATDVEVMRRADFLVGSFQSNMYRLSTELNLAYHAGHYPKSMNRHFAVDIEWYEDP